MSVLDPRELQASPLADLHTLAAELGLPYAAIALVTDYDAGIDGTEAVSQEVVFAVLERNVHRVRALLETTIPNL